MSSYQPKKEIRSRKAAKQGIAALLILTLASPGATFAASRAINSATTEATAQLQNIDTFQCQNVDLCTKAQKLNSEVLKDSLQLAKKTESDLGNTLKLADDSAADANQPRETVEAAQSGANKTKAAILVLLQAFSQKLAPLQEQGKTNATQPAPEMLTTKSAATVKALKDMIQSYGDTADSLAKLLPVDTGNEKNIHSLAPGTAEKSGGFVVTSPASVPPANPPGASSPDSSTSMWTLAGVGVLVAGGIYGTYYVVNKEEKKAVKDMTTLEQKGNADLLNTGNTLIQNASTTLMTDANQLISEAQTQGAAFISTQLQQVEAQVTNYTKAQLQALETQITTAYNQAIAQLTAAGKSALASELSQAEAQITQFLNGAIAKAGTTPATQTASTTPATATPTAATSSTSTSTSTSTGTGTGTAPASTASTNTSGSNTTVTAANISAKPPKATSGASVDPSVLNPITQVGDFKPADATDLLLQPLVKVAAEAKAAGRSGLALRNTCYSDGAKLLNKDPATLSPDDKSRIDSVCEDGF